MADGYHHLTYGSRCQIYALRESGLSLRGIGRQLRLLTVIKIDPLAAISFDPP